MMLVNTQHSALLNAAEDMLEQCTRAYLQPGCQVYQFLPSDLSTSQCDVLTSRLPHVKVEPAPLWWCGCSGHCDVTRVLRTIPRTSETLTTPFPVHGPRLGAHLSAQSVTSVTASLRRWLHRTSYHQTVGLWQTQLKFTSTSTAPSSSLCRSGWGRARTPREPR